ncbi:hypothetical protein glysoja_010385 [Glycine soja]|nr:hypothetical protein glysoja_010385 [Glycine soja]
MTASLISPTMKCFRVPTWVSFPAAVQWTVSSTSFSRTRTPAPTPTRVTLPAPISPTLTRATESAEKKSSSSKKRSLGNKEAVRKYREKKKARAASLEDEVVKLRALNQHLMKKLKGQAAGQAALEAEIARLKCLLVDIRGRIEGEIGSFPYQKPTPNANPPVANLPGSYVMNPCNLQCDDRVYCHHPYGKIGESAALNGEEFDGCEFENLQCLASQNLGLKDLRACGVGQARSNVNSSASNKRKGGT